jgi:inhibitor of KinA
VPAGSVAIGGEHTGIYPLDSPGGWHVVGRTPLTLFRVERDPPSLLQAGDRVRLVPIADDAFERCKARQGDA